MSHSGDPVHFNVTHRIVAVSANRALLVDERRVRREALEARLEYRTRPPPDAPPPDDEARDEAGYEHAQSAEEQVDRGQLEQEGAVLEGLVEAGGTVFDAVAPHADVDAGVQLRATILALVGFVEV